ncbi:hypothetical protein F2P56_032318 [Juglans regia]|uniref:Transcriptional regulator ATRX homolog isoform X1 n=2 Tax=Juglans regia TaxID=51240 RepID=A0A2I4FUK1_JUGRE|nr:transcriptional regulator ATRX homolog isoform X1 [Juglans regia]KAF5446714.1 hypothetical protein F2P56_032318 [Juglans regia]
MRLLSYSPSYSSSSSTTTFDANMCNSKSATAGCLAGILRRILCSGNLPTHPSDQIVEADSVVYEKDQEFKAKDKIETAATPGIVARLMGLESMPEINWMNSRSNPDSISRSRSMNSADHLAGFDPMQGQHRRVKSTLSFREMPTFLELENDNFLILSFENGGRSTELRSRGRNSDLSFGESKQRRAERCKKVENRTDRVSEKKKKKKIDNNKEDREDEKVLDNLDEREKRSKRISDKAIEKAGNNGKAEGSTITPSPSKRTNEKRQIAIETVKMSISSNHGEVINGGKLRKKKKKKKKKQSPCVVQKAEPECSSEDSSPVSVLDFGHFLIDRVIPTSDTDYRSTEEDSSLAESKSRRKLSSELENCRQKSPRKDDNLIGDKLKTQKIEGQYDGTKQKECQSLNYEDVWGEILRLTGAELIGSNWVCREIWKHEDFEGIGVNFEVGILDQLLDEVVGELSGLP